MKTKNSTFLRIVIPLAILLVAVVMTLAVVRYKSNNTVDSQKLQVVAAENFWGNIISQIGGDYVEVTSIISDPSADPHLYESDAHDAAAVAKANLVVTNGLGYDDFMDKLLSVSSNDKRQVLAVQKVLSVTGDNPNPHLWYDLPRISAVADSFEQALAKKDPTHANVYAANLATFKSSLQPILSVVQKIKSSYPNAPVAYTERVPGYLLAAAGLNVKTPVGFAGSIEDGNDPSPADTTTMDSLITTHAVRVLLYNSQATSPVTEHARDLARQAGLPVIGVTETLPKNEPTYQSWQLHQVQALLEALSK